MLTVSLAVHVSLVGGLALSTLHGTAISAVASSRTTMPPVMLLHSEKPPASQPSQPAPVVLTAARSVATSQPASLPTPAPSLIEKNRLALTQPPTQVLEANPNAHIQALPPEAVLSPSPAPRLDSANGVVFLLDISGSMYEPCAGSTRLACARQILAGRIRALKDGTPFAITLYALRACASGPLVAANDTTREAAVRYIMRDVDCGGGTNLPAGLAAAEELHPGAMVLVTDGDLNISAFNLATMARAILGPEDHCPGLTILGIAPRLDTGADQLLQSLADEQGGIYHVEQSEVEPPLLTSASSVTKPASATP